LVDVTFFNLSQNVHVTLETVGIITAKLGEIAAPRLADRFEGVAK